MNIAIFGAGRIGSAFAFHLARGGHAVTLIARGARLEQLRAAGKIVSVSGAEARVQVAAGLDPAVPFDLVVVTVLAQQVDALLPDLKASAAKTVLFMFNTFDPTDRLRDALGTERCAFGFPNMIAFLVDGKLRTVVDGPGMETTLSSPALSDVLKKAGLPARVEPDMTSFLRSHVAFVVPLMAAAQLTWKRRTNLTWAEASKLSGALVEAFAVVRGLGHALKPGFVAVMAAAPGVVLTLAVWMLARLDATRNLGEFGPGETRALIDAMAAAAPGKTPKLLAIRP